MQEARRRRRDDDDREERKAEESWSRHPLSTKKSYPFHL